MNRNEIENQVIEIITEIDPIAEVDTDTDLLEDVLDSMSILFVLTEIMQKMDVEIPMTEVTAENFASVGSIVSLIQKYE